MTILRYIRSDLHRYVGPERIGVRTFIVEYVKNPGFKFSVWLRLCHSRCRPLRALARLQHFRFKRKYFLEIPYQTRIGYGLYLGHAGCIVVSPTASIGNNVNLSHFSTVGAVHTPAAVIGDRVYVGPSACLVGAVTIGSDVKIGAGAVVTHDIPAHSVAAGVPARPIGACANNDYIQWPWPVEAPTPTEER
ncbi:serine O-acetyltransferase [Edwardsiella piscicida]|uniref:Serine acetyltransferase n=3 Tax=Edwardsiella TaxID=635 RepID=A0A0H3DTX4_EDWTF|nr:serine acetyltransferase [Edwardsiella piscicida]ACY84797.1 serine acetyltransferase-related protein [Edwardsiella tarda EIB202]ADM41878.1 Serine acetyltransferase [Edwardsiella tarda FL6-60]ARD19740.1 serine acetyltransferase [Edwardsiella piscicida]ELM3737277.1 serine acetyltransferase [Edwardsiella piscicida]MDM3863549.1 serine acetyltransferase [Edwardsiella piscicida]